MLDRRSFVRLTATSALAVSFPAQAAGTAHTVTLADGTSVPALGLGSWHMASSGVSPQQAEDAMRLGVALGLTLIDTAELYGDGRAEEMVAKVVSGQRDKIFLVSKVLPTHATEDGIERSVRASLQRLGTDNLDLYLLHWRKGWKSRLLDRVTFKEGDLKSAVTGFEAVRQRGLIKRWGVSNFSVADMEELFAVPGGRNCSTNQVLYNPGARGIEADLIPWCEKHKMPIMAYSPLGAGGKAELLSNPVLKKLAEARGVGPAAIALAWAMRNGRTIVVTETNSPKHIREDASAASLDLNEKEIQDLDEAFPPPHAG